MHTYSSTHGVGLTKDLTVCLVCLGFHRQSSGETCNPELLGSPRRIYLFLPFSRPLPLFETHFQKLRKKDYSSEVAITGQDVSTGTAVELHTPYRERIRTRCNGAHGENCSSKHLLGTRLDLIPRTLSTAHRALSHSFSSLPIPTLPPRLPIPAPPRCRSPAPARCRSPAPARCRSPAPARCRSPAPPSLS